MEKEDPLKECGCCAPSSPRITMVGQLFHELQESNLPPRASSITSISASTICLEIEKKES
jgi:hypothetical protein